MKAARDATIFIDLSFLSPEEEELIQKVLLRDEDLKKNEIGRVRWEAEQTEKRHGFPDLCWFLATIAVLCLISQYGVFVCRIRVMTCTNRNFLPVCLNTLQIGWSTRTVWHKIPNMACIILFYFIFNYPVYRIANFHVVSCILANLYSTSLHALLWLKMHRESVSSV